MTPTEGPGSKPATIREVAALAGVSHQTVSRFLNQDTGMRPGTIDKIKIAMTELHYSPNLAARALRSRQNYRVVVVLPDASQYVPIRVLNGAAKAAHLAGYRVDVVALEGTAKERMDSIATLLAGADLAGVLSFAPLSPEALGGTELLSRVPIVVAGAYDDKMRASGTFANGAATTEIMQYLHGLGHRNFFHVAGPVEWISARNRQDAYEFAIAELGLHSHGIARGDWSSKSGYLAASQVMASPDVTAVVVANDHMAFGVMRALHENGIAVPATVSVFGWDDLGESKYFVPSLSTVRMDLETQGSIGMKRLIALIRGENLAPELLSEPTMELVFRESCGPVRPSSQGMSTPTD